jgi:exopolysaccharide biosynthesis polyprenyl glycosylphosphotransferase
VSSPSTDSPAENASTASTPGRTRRGAVKRVATPPNGAGRGWQRYRSVPSALEEGDAARAVAARERAYRYALAVADMCAITVSIALAMVVIGGHDLRVTYLVALPLTVVVAKILGLYERDDLVIRKSTTDELPRLINLATTVALLVWIGRHYVVAGEPPTGALLALWLILGASACAFRILARTLAARVSAVERCLLLGDANTFHHLSAKLAHTKHAELADFIPLDEAIHHRGPSLHALARERNVHRIIIAANHAGENDATLNLVREAKATGLRVSILPGILGAVGSTVVFDDLWGVTVLGVPRYGLSRSSSAMKRTFDLLGAIPLVLLFAPVMTIAAILIKLDTPGPVFFRQTRVGRDGDHFSIFKFRTMIDGADAIKHELAQENEAADGLFKIAEDPRITRVGKFLRKSCMDELPQLFNVLRGEMSLVGPRPLVVSEDDRIKGLDRNRLHLTPGMTGPWQILGSSRVPLAEMVKLDYLYIASWTLWSDVKILLRTIPMVLERRGQ